MQPREISSEISRDNDDDYDDDYDDDKKTNIIIIRSQQV